MKKLLLAIPLIIGITGCFDDNPFDEKTFNGLFIEFDRVAASSNPEEFVLELDDGFGTLTETVNLVGRQQSASQTIDFSIKPEGTTAEAGVHYNLNGGSFTIPANSSTGELSIEILDGSIPTGEERTLIIVLVGNETIKVSENFKQLNVSIQGL